MNAPVALFKHGTSYRSWLGTRAFLKTYGTKQIIYFGITRQQKPSGWLVEWKSDPSKSFPYWPTSMDLYIRC